MFYLLYLVFLYYLSPFYALLRVFLSFKWCSSKKIKERANKSQMSWFWQSLRAWRNIRSIPAKIQRATWPDYAVACQGRCNCRILKPCCSMRSIPVKIQKATWPDYAAACQGRCNCRILKPCHSMLNPCRDMATFVWKIWTAYFWQVGLNVLRLLL